MKKVELRYKYKSLRDEFSMENIDDLSLLIANQVLKIPAWEHLYYHIYLTIDELKEVKTEYILNILAGKDKHIVISKCDFNLVSLKNYLLSDNTIIKKNAWGIPEPVDGIEIGDEKIEVVFVPLLAFDLHGHRVGYGKGFYDNFLRACNPKTIKIGLSFFEAETTIEDIHASDVRLDYCVTPNKVYEF